MDSVNTVRFRCRHESRRRSKAVCRSAGSSRCMCASRVPSCTQQRAKASKGNTISTHLYCATCACHWVTSAWDWVASRGGPSWFRRRMTGLPIQPRMRSSASIYPTAEGSSPALTTYRMTSLVSRALCIACWLHQNGRSAKRSQTWVRNQPMGFSLCCRRLRTRVLSPKPGVSHRSSESPAADSMRRWLSAVSVTCARSATSPISSRSSVRARVVLPTLVWEMRLTLTLPTSDGAREAPGSAATAGTFTRVRSRSTTRTARPRAR
jgi:hypothetical protein